MSDLEESCKEFVRSFARYLIGQSAVRIFFGELILLGAVRSLSGELQSIRICRVL